ncbi:ATP-binding cassette domain-containing protein [Thermomonospora echinospora]|uniref:ATP-binding cassette domain-containing protein n=1 Tax=Thermomonospora echinospora TaxID=1992 RepID=UPI001F383046|nr:ABC transporter ATP-binding protein [Thermomonospora echinospora]
MRTLVQTTRRRPRATLRLAAWSLVEVVPTMLLGLVVAHAVDAFQAGRTGHALAWLGGLAAAGPVGALGYRRLYAALAAVVEPFRDELVRTVVDGALRSPSGRPDTGAVARLTHQVEIVRDTFAGVLMVVRGFVFSVAAALVGLLTLAPAVLGLVVPPLLLGLLLFGAIVPAAAARQRELILGEERIAELTTALTEGLRDVVACGAEDRIAAQAGRAVDAQAAATRAVARLAGVRMAALAVGGWLPVLLILAAGPWLTRHGATAGTVVGAVTYVLQGLQPALNSLVQGVGGSGLRLAVTLTRILETAERTHPAPVTAPAGQMRTAPPATSQDGATPPHEDKRTRPAAAPAHAEPPKTGPIPAAQNGSTAGAENRETRPAATPTHAELPGAGPIPVTRNGSTAGAKDGETRPAVAPAHAGLPEAGSASVAGGGPGAWGRPTVVTAAARVPGAGGPPRSGAGVEVRLAGVGFAYGERAEPVIEGLDLVVPAGGHLAVVGPSGTGKSTLAALVAGMLVPGAGTVLVGGRPPGDPRTRVLIPQEAYVFDGTLHDNLTYLAPQAGDAAVVRAVDEIGLSVLAQRIGGYGGRVDPAALSAGERQLIALARAYLAAAPLTILDEATCHLDPAAEARAERAFARRPGTLIVIAHRMTSALRAPRVLLLDGARAWQGGHAELLERSARYRDLFGHWRSQPAGGLGNPDGVHPVAGADLAVDAGQMVADGPDGEHQCVGDLRGRSPLPRQP